MEIKETNPVANIDYERNNAIVSLLDKSPKALFISKGDPALLLFPDFGEITIKTHEGKISYIDVKEKHDYKSLAIK